ncbi:hypothetical protein D6817_03530 [Candidatus Pacearchaeota archaeon]|nr:MAG: hypothetical protein D6817_03530 [Candidatus Pacearchaeota archaeon]
MKLSYTDSALLRGKRGASERLNDEVVFLIIFAVFIAVMVFYVGNRANNAAFWEDFYAKELAKMINLAKPGDEFRLDVHKATEIAQKNKVKSFSEIFVFDNAKSEVCVKLSPGSAKCYSYFVKLDVVDEELELAAPKNMLKFKVIEKVNEK